MANVKVNWETLLSNLHSRFARLEDFNLVMVALPLETAHEDAPKLADQLGAKFIDFDQKLLNKLEEDDWEEHVSLTKHGHLEPGRNLAEQMVNEALETLGSVGAIMIGNPNLAAYYGLDLGALLYGQTKEGHCVLAAPGRVSGGTLLLHGIHPQTGSGFMPIWELVKD